jgi:gas vesicle protein
VNLERRLERLPGRLTEQVDKVRDRTAEAVGADNGSVLREVGKLGRHLDGLGETLADRLDRIGETLDEVDERVDGLHAEAASTTWPRRLFWLLVGAGIGACAGYLGDPDRGQDRREQIKGQTTTRAREVRDEVSHRADDVKQQAVTSANSVKTEAQLAAQDVANEAQQAAQEVSDEAQHAATDVRDQAQTSTQRATDDARQTP